MRFLEYRTAIFLRASSAGEENIKITIYIRFLIMRAWKHTCFFSHTIFIKIYAWNESLAYLSLLRRRRVEYSHAPVWCFLFPRVFVTFICFLVICQETQHMLKIFIVERRAESVDKSFFFRGLKFMTHEAKVHICAQTLTNQTQRNETLSQAFLRFWILNRSLRACSTARTAYSF